MFLLTATALRLLISEYLQRFRGWLMHANHRALLSTYRQCGNCCLLQVRYVGEREVPERMSTEHLRTEERVVEETVTSPCSPLECNGCVPTSRGVAGNGVRALLTTFAAACLSTQPYWVASVLAVLMQAYCSALLFCTAVQSTALVCCPSSTS